MANKITVKVIDGGYAVKTAIKDQTFIDRLKANIPPGQRSWKPEHVAWLIDPRALGALKTVINYCGFPMPDFPPIGAAPATVIQKTMVIEYLGQCKEREDKSITALGQVNGYWSVEIPEGALKSFFERAGYRPLATDAQTYYQTLCVFENADDQAIKQAHRKLARQWHPDVCGEPDAPEMFRQIQEAYEALRDPQARARYDAGLYFEREAAKRMAQQNGAQSSGRRLPKRFENPHYRAPLRCGVVTVEGVQALNKFKVSRIISWDDATDEDGRIMSSSWDRYSKTVKIKWL